MYFFTSFLLLNVFSNDSSFFLVIFFVFSLRTLLFISSSSSVLTFSLTSRILSKLTFETSLLALKNANINADFYMAGKYKKNHAFSIKESLYNKIIKSDAIEYLGAWDQNTFLKNTKKLY